MPGLLTPDHLLAPQKVTSQCIPSAISMLKYLQAQTLTEGKGLILLALHQHGPLDGTTLALNMYTPQARDVFDVELALCDVLERQLVENQDGKFALTQAGEIEVAAIVAAILIGGEEAQ